MKRKVLVSILAFCLMTSALVGCGNAKSTGTKASEDESVSAADVSSGVGTDTKGNQQDGSDDATQGNTTSEGVVSATLNTDGNTQDGSNSGSTETGSASDLGASAEGGADNKAASDEAYIQNNGHYFVKVGDSVYYRKYNADAIVSPSVGANFLYFQSQYEPSDIMMYIPDIDYLRQQYEDYGYGPLYYYDGWLYSTSMSYTDLREQNPGADYSDSYVYRHRLNNLGSSMEEYICEGSLVGCSEDGTYMTIEGTDPDHNGVQAFYYLSRGELANWYTYASENENMTYLGMYEDKAFFVTSEYGIDQENLYQYDIETGKLTLLGYWETTPEMNGGIEPEDFQVSGAGKISFQARYYQGTGHFESAVMDVKAKIDWENSVVCSDIYNPGNAEYAQGDDYVPDPVQTNLNHWPDKGVGTCRNVLVVDRIGDDQFIMQADCHLYQLAAVGWRDGYFFTGMDYLRSQDDGVTTQMISRTVGNKLMADCFLVGQPGSKAKSLMYQSIEMLSVEDVNEDKYSYVAPIADDFVYFEIEDYESVMKTQADFYDKATASKDNYLADPASVGEADFYGYPHIDTSAGANGRKGLRLELGFNDKGEINYICPVFVD